MPNNILNIFVDYDNLDKISKNRGLKFIVNGIISRLDETEFNEIKDLTIRLYGGWYSAKDSTSVSQSLSIEIVRDFPNIFINTKTQRIFKVKVELAYGLLISPMVHFYNTYRIRGFQSDIKAVNPSEKGCVDPNCPTRLVYQFINFGTVQSQCCKITPEDMLYKGVQKLVDNMLCCDIFYVLKNNMGPVVIVSSDEDFWPIIFFVFTSNIKIIHINTKPDRAFSKMYKQTANTYYSEKLIWQII